MVPLSNYLQYEFVVYSFIAILHTCTHKHTAIRLRFQMGEPFVRLLFGTIPHPKGIAGCLRVYFFYSIEEFPWNCQSFIVKWYFKLVVDSLLDYMIKVFENVSLAPPCHLFLHSAAIKPLLQLLYLETIYQISSIIKKKEDFHLL